jgi:hypothetical protein
MKIGIEFGIAFPFHEGLKPFDYERILLLAKADY